VTAHPKGGPAPDPGRSRTPHPEPAPLRAWVDANVLLRLVTDDPPEMAAAAAAFAERAADGELSLRLSPLVVAEMTWVLGSFYGFPADRIAGVLSTLVRADGVTTEEEGIVLGALQAMARAGVDFVDAYLAEKARASKEAIASFDDDFDRLDVERITLGVDAHS
jgi:predicted nucleic acid-binding protein